MVHILDLQLLIKRRYAMTHVEPLDNRDDVEYIDELIKINFHILLKIWISKNRPVNQLYVSICMFCKKYNYDYDKIIY